MNKLLILLAFIATPAFSDTNEYVVSQRSVNETYGFFSEGIDAELGTYTVNSASETWKGHSLTTNLGAEFWRFLDLEMGYSQVSAQNSKDQLENLNGGKLHLGLRLEFSAPLFNLEFGGGGSVSKLTYINHEDSKNLYGKGTYGTIGVSRYLNKNLSVFFEGKYTTESLSVQGDSSFGIKTSMTSVTLGLRLWY